MNSKLMQEVNPVFTTAQACLLVLAEKGDADAQRLVKELGFDSGIASVGKDALTEMEKFQKMKSIPGFTTMIEALFKASSNLILSSPMKEVLDLPCGYTPRGGQLSRSGIRYYGLDLPIVAQAMSNACKNILDASYHPVDATNYDTLRSALREAQGELLITTEGLLMYLTQSELEETFRNMHRILEEFGGFWVTTDNEIVETQKRLITVLAPGRESGERDRKPENAFFDPD